MKPYSLTSFKTLQNGIFESNKKFKMDKNTNQLLWLRIHSLIHEWTFQRVIYFILFLQSIYFFVFFLCGLFFLWILFLCIFYSGVIFVVFVEFFFCG